MRMLLPMLAMLACVDLSACVRFGFDEKSAVEGKDTTLPVIHEEAAAPAPADLPAPAPENVVEDCDPTVAGQQLMRSCYRGHESTEGVGQCRAGMQDCIAGAWGPCIGEVLPAVEICDGLDNDCDGQIDQGFDVGSSCIVGVGQCVASGATVCTTDGAIATCSVVAKAKTAEICDGLDNDCDGQIDESCACTAGRTQRCGTGVGACQQGTQTCDVTGSWGDCQGSVVPTPETCNDLDDDCDGSIDEELTRDCYTGPSGTAGVGQCRRGTERCEGGTWSSCVGDITPATENCNDLDDDCDGSIDEGITRACYSGPVGTAGVGRCTEGTQTCQRGAWGPTCDGELTPIAEDCNNVDDDCDGSVDEELTRDCYTGPAGTGGVGQCRSGTQSCSAGAWGECAGEVTPSVETCDGLDNDCNGQIDECCWTDVASGTSSDLSDVWGTSSTDVYTSGGTWTSGPGIVRHFDGQSWREVASFPGTSGMVWGMWGADTDNVYLARSGVVVRGNAANGFASMAQQPGLLNMRAVAGTSNSDILVMGRHGEVSHFDGTAWTRLYPPTSADIYAAWSPAPGEYLVVGDGGLILHYDGSGWTTMQSGVTTTLMSVWGLSPSEVYAVGFSGTMLRYDGGVWTKLPTAPADYLYDVWGTSSGDLFVAIYGGAAHFDGESWRVPLRSSNFIEGIWGWGDEVFAVGRGGAIHHVDRCTVNQ